MICRASVACFLFKQKTAYEMRISDWSSDVCSSDLLVGLISTLAALAIGVPLGAVAGYAGGRVDDALMRFTEFFQTIPSFALAIVLVAILQPSIEIGRASCRESVCPYV